MRLCVNMILFILAKALSGIPPHTLVFLLVLNMTIVSQGVIDRMMGYVYMWLVCRNQYFCSMLYERTQLMIFPGNHYLFDLEKK